MPRIFPSLLLAAFILMPVAALAQTPSQVPGKSVTLTIINGDFLTTLVRLERQYHIQCVLQDSIDAHSKINVALSGVLLPLAMRCLALSADAQVTQNPDGVYVFTPKPVVPPKGPVYPMTKAQFEGSFGNMALFAEPFPYSVRFLHAHPPLIVLPDLLSGRNTGNIWTKEGERVYALD